MTDRDDDLAVDTADAPPITRPPGGAWVRRVVEASSTQIFLVLVGIVVVFSVLDPDRFLTADNTRNLFVNVAILSVTSVGMTFVIILGGIDLSVGAVLVFSGVVCSKVMERQGGNGWGTVVLGLVAALLSGLAWGMLNGVLVAKAKVPALLVTLGTLGMALGFAQILTKGIDQRGAPDPMVDTIGFGRLFGQIPYLVIVAAVVVVMGGVILHLTRFGRYTYAIGSNAEGARRAGLRVDRHLITTYGAAGLLAGLAGFLNLAFFESTTIGGHANDNLNAITAVVIGGTSLFGGVGTMVGTVVGVFIPAVLQNGFIIRGIQSFWQQVAVGAALIVAVYIDQLKRRSRGRS